MKKSKNITKKDKKLRSDLYIIVCPECGGTGQDDPPPGSYHGLCDRCNGKGTISKRKE